VGAPSGDADAEAAVDGQETPASFDQLLRRAAAARARHRDDSEPDQTAAVVDGEAAAPSEPDDRQG
jgi:hypothetical protein